MDEKAQREKEIAELETKKASLLSELDTISKSINTGKANVEAMTVEVEMVKQSVSVARIDADTAINAMAEEIKAKRVETNSVLVSIGEEVRKASERAEVVYGTLKALENDVEVQEKALKAVKEEIAIQNAGLLAEFRAKQAEIDDKMGDLRVIERRQKSAEDTVKTLSARAVEIQADSVKIGEQIAEAEKTLASINEKIANRDQEYRMASQVIETAKDTRMKLESLTVELNRKIVEKTNLDNELALKNQELIKIQSERERIEKINLGLVGRVEKLQRAQSLIKAYYEKAGVPYTDINFQ